MNNRELRPSAAAQLFDSSVRGAFVGAVWGATAGYCFDPKDAKSLPLSPLSRAAFAASLSGRFATVIAAVMATYSVTHCALEAARGRDDVLNHAVGGMLAGAVLSLGPGMTPASRVTFVLAGGAMLATAAFGSHMQNPFRNQ